MPYGIDKELGGDNEENIRFMESCVSRVKGQRDKNGKVIDKGSAIAICKSALRKKKTGNSSFSIITLNDDIIRLFFL